MQDNTLDRILKENIEKIELETLYTPYTLDTYSIFNFDSTIESEIECYNNENETDFNSNDFDWVFKTDEYLNALSINLVKLLNAEILDNVIKKVEGLDSVHRPREYNFTTDKTTLTFSVDKIKLEKYINDNKEDYKENKIQSCSGFIWLGSELETMLNYYLKTVSEKLYSKYDYMIEQMSDVSDYEYIEMTLIKD